MTFPILHLSDAHIGLRDLDTGIVLEPLLEKLKTDVEEVGSPRLLVFSGDLVFGQQGSQPKLIEDQFAQAETFLDCVYNALGTDQIRTPLAIVPGNHDINRDELDPTLTDYTLTAENIGILTKHSNFKRFMLRQKAFASFAEKYNAASSWSWNWDWLSWDGTLKSGEKTISIVGLNTSWTCTPKDERGKLWIGDSQFERAITYGKDADFRILITHHPTWWLADDEQLRIQSHIETYFHLHLHGHEHVGWFTDPTGHVRVAAGACYQGSRMACGYNWITLDCEKSQPSLKLHLREYRSEVREWIARDLGKKAPSGIAILDSPWRQRPDSEVTQTMAEDAMPPTLASEVIPFASLENSAALCDVLQRTFLADIGNPQIPGGDYIEYLYWPVRRRHPTIVHAAQAFMAAAFARKGASVTLWVDDVGKAPDEQQRHLLVKKLELWFKKVSPESGLNTRFIQDLLLDPAAQATCETFRRWLGDSDGSSLRRVLQVSKVLRNINATLDDVLAEKPGRLLNPPLVWTGLTHILSDNIKGYATLGGVDERELWKAWSIVCPQYTHSVTHVFCARLMNFGDVPYNMDLLTGFDKAELQGELQRELYASDSHDSFLRLGGIAHWCYTYLVRLPAYIVGESATLKIRGKEISKWEQITESDTRYLPESLAESIVRWIS